MRINRLIAACLLPLALANVGTANANVIYSVNLNTTQLAGAPGEIALAFQLNDGGGIGDSNNVVMLSNFTFGGGSASSCPLNCLPIGDASGDANTAITLVDEYSHLSQWRNPPKRSNTVMANKISPSRTLNKRPF